MRTTDDPFPPPFKGLGEKVIPKPAPAPASSSPPRGPSGLATDKDGRLSTTNHKPHSAMTLEEAIANWHEHYASDMTLDFLP